MAKAPKRMAVFAFEMKIHHCLQQSEEWVRLHIGKVSASGLHNLLTPEFKIRTGEMARSYMYAKVAEAYRGFPMLGFGGSWATDQGNIREDDARRWYAFEHEDKEILNVGFCESDDGRVGCSPDALIGETSGLELKSPQPVNHLRYLMEGVLPAEYRAQVHGSIYVTGRPEWEFVSFCPHFPPFVLTVKRDEKIMTKIKGALASFHLAFDGAMARLKQLNAA